MGEREVLGIMKVLVRHSTVAESEIDMKRGKEREREGGRWGRKRGFGSNNVTMSRGNK